MADIIPFTNQKQRREAETGVAEGICEEIIQFLFHDADDRGWIRLPHADHFETLPLDGREIRTFFRREFWNKMKALTGHGALLDGGTLAARIELLTAKAQFDGPEKPVFLRVGKEEEVIYIDLCDANWRAVRISADGWEIVDQPDVYFRRARGMLALPVPERGGSLDELQPFLNVTPDQFVLVKAWLLAALRPVGPYALLVPIGSAGSAKSNLCRIVRALVDPNSSPLNSPPREMRDLNTIALTNHVLGYDNLSHLNPQLSDALCRLATGSSTVERRLYSNNEPVRYPQMYRPILMNGVTEFVTAPDLLDRSIILSLPAVSHRRTEASLWREFDAVKPRIFGGMLDLLVQGVRNLAKIEVPPDAPRMTEFVHWSVACGIQDFEDRYRRNLVDNNLALIENDPLCVAIKLMMNYPLNDPYDTSAAQLLALVQELGYSGTDPRALSAELRKLAPALRTALGIGIDFSRTATRRGIRIYNIKA